MTYPLILDISYWQGDFNAVKAKAAGAVGVIIRATSGDYYIDQRFAANYDAAVDAGLLVGAYHVFVPTCSAAGQSGLFLKTVGDRLLHFPYVMDCELSNNQNPYTVTTNLKATLAYIPKVNNRLPMIYTRKYWWDYNILASPDWASYPLWVAHYTTAPDPLLPRDWATWTLWQFSADGNGLGSTYGVQSDSVDINRFNGTMEELAQFCCVGTFPPPPTEPEKVTVTASALNIRAAATTQASRLGSAYYGSTWDVVGSAKDAAGKTWYKVAGWVHGDYVK